MNIIIVGAGHYVLGRHHNIGVGTDKDLGIVLPYVSYLQSISKVSGIALVGRDRLKVADCLRRWKLKFFSITNLEPKISIFPSNTSVDECGYREAMDHFSPRDSVVMVCTPDSTHLKIVSEFVGRGFNIFVVKPLVTSLRDFDLIERTLDTLEIKPIVYVDYHKLYDPQNIMLRRKIADGLFGRVQLINSIQTQRNIMKGFYSEAIKENPLYNVNHYLGCHYIHQTSYLTNCLPRTVRAVGYGEFATPGRLSGLDVINLQVDWESNESAFTSAHISGWNDPNSQAYMTRQKFSVIAERGFADLVQDQRGFTECVGSGPPETPNPHFFSLPRGDNSECLVPESYYGLRSIECFLEFSLANLDGTLKTERFNQHPNSMARSRVVTSILEAADRSLLEGSKVVNV